MTVQNENQTVPDQVRDIFFGFVPYGSDYLMYCDSSDTSGVSYTCLFRRVGSDSFDSISVSRPSGSNLWSVSSVSDLGDVEAVSVLNPYYCYSNCEGLGRYTVHPGGQNLSVLMLVVIASLLILKIVFGGVKLWRERSLP